LFILPIEDGKPNRYFPLANLLLIGLNIYIFLNTAFREDFEKIIRHFGFIPAHPHLANVIASMFLHEGFGHILGNMYFLYVFGNKVESALGKMTYLLAYFLSGFGACFLQYMVDPHSKIPMIGASGAISGICALYMVLFPWQKMRLQFFFIIFPLFALPARAIFVVGFWFLEQYMMATLSPLQSGGVAFWAHVGGFLTAIALYPFLFSDLMKQKVEP
jgi:membrane associated rhomboid family serine protease